MVTSVGGNMEDGVNGDQCGGNMEDGLMVTSVGETWKMG